MPQHGSGSEGEFPAEPATSTAPAELVDEARDPEVHAAGAVLWRSGPRGLPEIAVVHRPRYGDWSLPKGKVDPGETVAHTAAREVTEETGLTCVLSRGLRGISYPVPTPDGRRALKHVHYFAARALPGEFVPNEEVDQLCWVPLSEAHEWLTYPADNSVVDSFGELPPTLHTVLLVRHARAGRRADFSGDDTLRPLSAEGWRERHSLHTLLTLFGPEKVRAAPRLRCEQTVASLAEELGQTVGQETTLSEEAYRQAPEAGVRRVLNIAATGETTVVCSQGGVIPDLLTRLARSSGLPLGEVGSRKASVWVLSFLPETHSGNGTGPAPRLVAADYFPDPAPERP